MRIAIFFALTFLSFTASAQYWNPVKQRTRYSVGLGLPVTDSASLSNATDTALLYINKSDTTALYWKYRGAPKKINPGETTVLDAVSNFSTLNNASSKSVVVTDTVRGGLFNKYSGSDAADNGMIFTDATGQKWKRSIAPGERINVAWYGFSDTALISTATNYDAFMAAFNYGIRHKNYNRLLIPEGTFNINQTIYIDTSIDVSGIGDFYDWRTVLVFPQNTTGFRLRTIEGGLLNTVAAFSNLEIKAYANYFDPGALTLDSTKHGFDISCIPHFTNVHVNGWSGNGFNIDACAAPAAPNYGNADNGYFIYCAATTCDNGIKLKGCDANIITVHNGNWTLNRRFGVWDNGFLGNDYQKNHFAFNGVYKTYCTAEYGGLYYAAINPDSLINIAKRPDTATTYWKRIYFTPETVNVWSAGTKYWAGGVYLLDDPNNYTTMHSQYSEEGQPGGRSIGRSITMGGDNGSGVDQGAYIYSDDGYLRIKNVGLAVIRANGDAANTQTSISNGASGGITMESSSATLQMSPVQIGIGTTGKGIGFIYAGLGQYLKNGTPYVFDKFGFQAPGTDGFYASLSINGTKPSGANAQTGNTNYHYDETIIHSDVYGAEANSFAWKPDANGDVPSTLGAENFIAQITPHQKDYTSTNDTWKRFYFFNVGYDADEMIMKYTVSITATTSAGDMWVEERKVVFKKTSGNVPTQISNDLIGTATKDAAMTTCDYRFDFNGTGFNLELKGLAATNVHWVVTLTKEVNTY